MRFTTPAPLKARDLCNGLPNHTAQEDCVPPEAGLAMGQGQAGYVCSHRPAVNAVPGTQDRPLLSSLTSASSPPSLLPLPFHHSLTQCLPYSPLFPLAPLPSSSFLRRTILSPL